MDHSDPTFNQLQIGNLALHKTKKKSSEKKIQRGLSSNIFVFLYLAFWFTQTMLNISGRILRKCKFEFRSLKIWTARCSLSLYRAFLYDIWNNNLLNFFLRVGILRFHHIKTLGLIIRGIEKEKINPQQIFL